MRFSFHRGCLALDFVGTVGLRASPAPEERLPDPAALTTWLREARLPAPARVTPAELAAARVLREALHALVAAVVDGRPLDRDALAIANAAARERGAGSLELDGRGRASWRTSAPIRLGLALVAEDAILRLTQDAGRLTRCELPGCGALLLSRSRSEPRRWCSMETCGNRAKAAAFRARQRERR